MVGNSFSSFFVALEYKVTLSLVLELVRASGDIIRLSPRALSESDIYLASPDIEVSRTNKREVVRHLSDLLAVRAAARRHVRAVCGRAARAGHPLARRPDGRQGAPAVDSAPARRR